MVNDGDAASSIAVSNEKEQFIEHILRGPKPGKIKDEWRIHPDDRGKFFVYQPTGGWGNQRMILKSAIAAANAMGRVLVLPMISPRWFFAASLVIYAHQNGDLVVRWFSMARI